MACQEVAFAAAKCQIAIARTSNGTGLPDYAATMAVIDEATGTLRPLVALDGRPAEVHAESEPHALWRAIGFLERHLGVSRQVALWCDRPPLPIGAPITVAE